MEDQNKKKKNTNVLVIIPARGGSKGIARKNLRSLNGKPLIYYSIMIASKSKFNPDVYVSSEDDEILSLAQKLGAFVYKRPEHLSKDNITLDPVIVDAFHHIRREKRNKYDLVVTLQPTSPLLKPSSLDQAISRMIEKREIDTVISAKKEAHLSWRFENGKYVPNYKERLNRQFLEPYFIETGAFLISRSANLITYKHRIGEVIDLFILDNEEAIDIDSYVDWNICEYYLKRKRILFVVAGHKKVGLGHVYRALTLANSITNHEVIFLLTKGSDLGFDLVTQRNYCAYMQNDDSLSDEIIRIEPDVVINDILNTNKEYVLHLKNNKIKVINFEDLGEGAEYADVVFNALYPENTVRPNHYFGPNYFCARDEFIFSETKKVNKKVKNILITFGGVDENNLTKKVLEAIYDYCVEQNIKINVITGLGYEKFSSLKKFSKIGLLSHVNNISEFMLEADVIFSSAGRTVYEIALLGVPAIIISQNLRELTHFFASPENGFVNLGLGAEVSKEQILNAFKRLVHDYSERLYMSQLMLSRDIKSGKERVLKIINQTIEEIK